MDISNGIFTIIGGVIGAGAAIALEYIKSMNQLKLEKIKLLYTEKAKSLSCALRLCDDILKVYDPNGDPYYAGYQRKLQGFVDLKPYYYLLPPVIVDRFEEYYEYFSGIQEMNDPEIDTSAIKEFFENELSKKISTLRQIIIAEIKLMSL